MHSADGDSGVDAWRGAVRTASEDVLAGLGMAGIEVRERGAFRVSQGGCGSLISLVNDDVALQLAFMSDERGARFLAAAMLGLDDGELDTELVADALCELANMVGGLVKSHVTARTTGLRLGLPIHVDGAAVPPTGAVGFELDFTVSGHPLRVGVCASAP
ncbi:MAG TPA: chemotaxis protein CheX [Sandaracinaceae bacterium LLY-WYZ-13_1]|nr:chemotaxis protein CheX [Sandaracinaceae bacterium LLY-WYZ-13_1]